uniref:Uncharacterized protein n=1 Tax=Arion vulgaris TaxID=1028688 RepID=A0A0B6Z2C1_9EUPU
MLTPLKNAFAKLSSSLQIHQHTLLPFHWPASVIPNSCQSTDIDNHFDRLDDFFSQKVFSKQDIAQHILKETAAKENSSC